MKTMRAIAGAFVVLAALLSPPGLARAQSQMSHSVTGSDAAKWEPPVMDNTIVAHALFDQLEWRTNGQQNEFRWEGQGWIGTDMNKFWLKSEGFVQQGKATDGDQEALYDRPIPYLRYFDAQAGVRYDLDSNPGRTWGAGIQGLAPYFFELAPTFYFSDKGRFAGRVEGSYDLLITQRLIVQPQFEINFYRKKDPSRGIGSGLSDLDTGLRIRYEITRKFAPYIGFAYTQEFGETATFTRNEGNTVHNPGSCSARASGTSRRA